MVIRINTDKGTVVIESDDPDVEVVVKQGGKQIEIIDLKTKNKIELKGGEYEFQLAKEGTGLRLSTDRLTLMRGDKKMVKIRRAEGLPKEITNSIGMKLVLIPAGKFVMGSPASEANRQPDEEQHQVEITKPFYMGVYTVTQAEYEKVMGKNPSYFSATGGGKDRVQGKDTSMFPVEQVSWSEAVEFCSKLSELPEEKDKGRQIPLAHGGRVGV